jgi:hypothetical protein
MALQPDSPEAFIKKVEKKRPLTRLEQTQHVLGEMKHLKIAERAKNRPDWSGWDTFKDHEKLSATQEMLQRAVVDWMLDFVDHRGVPSEKDELRLPYHNPPVAVPELFLRKYGLVAFDKAMQKGNLYAMVAKLAADKHLKPGIDLEDSFLSVAASTGSTPTLWQHAQMLNKLIECRLVVKKNRDWEDSSAKLEMLISEQEEILWKVYGLERKGGWRDGVLMRSQSGTDSMLANALFGIDACALMDEGATGGQLAASGRHPSKTPIRGGKEREEDVVEGEKEKGWYKKLKGLEALSDASEFEFRTSEGNLADQAHRARRTEEWVVARFDEIEKKQAQAKLKGKYTPSRAMLSVTLGSKTNQGLDFSQLSEALRLRDKYGEGTKQRLIIEVDASQGRLTHEQMQYLLTLGVIIDLTGSKTDEGPMFSAIRYIPNSLAVIAQQETQAALESNSDFLMGLGEYYTRGDMKALLGEKLAQHFPDIPNTVSLLKWEPVVQAKLLEQRRSVDEKAIFPGLVYDLRRSLVGKLDKCGMERTEKGWLPKQINGHSWEIEVLDEHTPHLDNPRMNTSIPFRVLIDGKVMKEDVMKWLRDEMGNPGTSGYMVQIGQYVAKADVDRFAYGLMTETSLVEAFSRNDPHTFMEGLNNRLVDKLTEVIELKLSELPMLSRFIDDKEVHVLSDREQQYWLLYGAELNAKLEEKLGVGTPELKLLACEQATYQILRDPSIMPVVFVSGKSALNLKVTYEAHMRVWKERLAADALLYDEWKKQPQLPPRPGVKKVEFIPLKVESLTLAFVDHPYILKGKDGNDIDIDQSDYAVLVNSLKQYEHTQLCLWEVSPKLEAHLKEKDVLDRCTICSRPPEKPGMLKAEYLHPKWYKHYDQLALEDVEGLNLSYKTKPTEKMIKFFTRLAQTQNKRCMIVRGVGRRKERKDDKTLFLDVAQTGTFLGLHPLLYMTEEDVAALNMTVDMPVNPMHWDHLKEAMKTHLRGIESVFLFQHIHDDNNTLRVLN